MLVPTRKGGRLGIVTDQPLVVTCWKKNLCLGFTDTCN